MQSSLCAMLLQWQKQTNTRRRADAHPQLFSRLVCLQIIKAPYLLGVMVSSIVVTWPCDAWGKRITEGIHWWHCLARLCVAFTEPPSRYWREPCYPPSSPRPHINLGSVTSIPDACCTAIQLTWALLKRLQNIPTSSESPLLLHLMKPFH